MVCKCEPTKQVRQIGNWDGCPLEGGGHTQFFVQRCLGCGGICGFPQSNFDLALEKGTPETKKTMAEIIEDWICRECNADMILDKQNDKYDQEILNESD